MSEQKTQAISDRLTTTDEKSPRRFNLIVTVSRLRGRAASIIADRGVPLIGHGVKPNLVYFYQLSSKQRFAISHARSAKL